MIGTNVAYAAQLLRAGDVVAIPTETVYGLAGNGFSEQSVKKIYSVKQRPLSNPLILHVPDRLAIAPLVTEMPDAAVVLLDHFSPGPLTVLLPKSALVPEIITAGLPHVAVRIPKHPIALSLLQAVDFPLAAPSANPFGYISPTKAEHVQEQLGELIPYILDGGMCERGIESTVVGFRDDEVLIHRAGAITPEQISAVWPHVSIVQKKSATAGSPGFYKFHYAPHTPLLLAADIEEASAMADEETAVVSFKTQALRNVKEWICLSNTGSLDEAAQKLFDTLHKLDKLRVRKIIVERFPDYGLGVALNERLERAANRH